MEPNCVCCGVYGPAVQVHHIYPFHYVVALGRPDLELDHRNLITLCETTHDRPAENHHLLIGHLDDFKSSNLNAELDASSVFYQYKAVTIEADPQWNRKREAKLKALDDMTDAEKQDLRLILDFKFPVAAYTAVLGDHK